MTEFSRVFKVLTIASCKMQGVSARCCSSVCMKLVHDNIVINAISQQQHQHHQAYRRHETATLAMRVSPSFFNNYCVSVFLTFRIVLKTKRDIHIAMSTHSSFFRHFRNVRDPLRLIVHVSCIYIVDS